MMSESNDDYSETLGMACAFTCIAAKRKAADAKRPPFHLHLRCKAASLSLTTIVLSRERVFVSVLVAPTTELCVSSAHN
jgi:hypothetical protein